MQFTKEAMRARFAELQATIKEIEGRAAPLRQERDDFVNAARARELEMNADIKEEEAGLFELRQEAAMLVRALNGKTGQPADEPATEPAEDAAAE